MQLVHITGITSEGAGVGRLDDGRVTFVHRTAVGDRVEARLTDEKPRWTRAELVRVVRPGPARREAPCPHYDRCGGCTLEHIEYPAQLESKAGIATDALRRIGGLELEVADVTPSPSTFRYRNRVTFTLRRGPNGVVAGFHELEAPDRIVDVTAGCLLPEAAIAEAWAALRAAWGPDAGRLPSGQELRVTLRASGAGEVALVIDGGYAPGRPEELLAAVDPLVAVWHRPERARSYRLVAGEDVLREAWAGEALELSGDVFTQVNREAAALLETHVLERVRAWRPGRVLDAYCGVGLYGRRLTRDGVDVVGIEAHPEAAAEARRAASGSRILEGTVGDRLEEALPVDVAILNPPRTGVEASALARLAVDGPPAMVYVSCDPATLARDLKRLGDGYEVRDVRCFDLFPQTAHVETVVELERCATT
ncbi:MAG: TRAM domain-containing protein [Longimicrobiales bacterium]|nr:TRAM domain-containing protein [Longimicrobiales bacterium]